jgi:phage gp29-like protein
VQDSELQAAMQGLFAPLLQAIDGATNFEDALAAAEGAYPQMDKAKLQSLLARAMFGAEAFGREEATP